MRIASLSPTMTEILCEFGLSEHIICTDQLSQYPAFVKDIPHLRGHTVIDEKTLLKYAPDLVLTCTSIQTALSEKLKSEGFSCVHFDPRTVHQIYDSIRSLGVLLDAEQSAHTLISSMQKGLNDVKKKAKHLQTCPRLYIEEWHNPPFASGNWVPEMTSIAGGQQFPIGRGCLSREVTEQEVSEWDPDLIVISWCGAGDKASKDLLLQRKGWEDLRAIKERSVRVIDDSLLNRPGPRLIDGAHRLYAWIFEYLHSAPVSVA